MLRCTKC